MGTHFSYYACRGSRQCLELCGVFFLRKGGTQKAKGRWATSTSKLFSLLIGRRKHKFAEGFKTPEYRKQNIIAAIFVPLLIMCWRRIRKAYIRNNRCHSCTKHFIHQSSIGSDKIKLIQHHFIQSREFQKEKDQKMVLNLKGK